MQKSEIAEGIPVIYWSVITEKGERYYAQLAVIRSEPWELGSGAVVCKITGKTGGVSIDHLDPITPGSLMAAKCSGLNISNKDINQATQDFFKARGIDVQILATK